MDKRDFLKTGALLGAAGLGAIPALAAASAAPGIIPGIDVVADRSGRYILPDLPYEYNALEPHIDEATMRLHHDKHHAGYVKGLNNATDQVKKAVEKQDYSLIKHWQRELAFHGSGHFLHTIFWNIMGPKPGSRSTTLDKMITQSFGSFAAFESYFKAAAKKVEGSGWGILAYQPNTDKLVVLQAEKHQNLGQWISIPLLVVDVWEHAYYLNYQNNRGAYLDGFMNVINWTAVSKRLEYVMRQAGGKPGKEMPATGTSRPPVKPGSKDIRMQRRDP